jgi:putative salt-induced outer membrane protein YdiY
VEQEGALKIVASRSGSPIALGKILGYQPRSAMHQSVKRLLFASSALALVLPGALAQDASANAPAAPAPAAEPIPDKPKGWETSVGLQLGLAGGNSDNFNVGANFLTQKSWDPHSVQIGGNINYGESTTQSVDNGQLIETDVTNVNNYGAFLQYNYALSERWYVGARVEGRHDEIAGLDYRIAATTSVGYFLIKKEKLTLSVEAGPGYVWQQFDNDAGENTDYATIRFAENLEWKFADKSRLFQSFEYLPDISDWGLYTANATVGVETDIAKGLALQVVFKNFYNSRPPFWEGTTIQREKNDYQLLAGIIYKFN